LVSEEIGIERRKGEKRKCGVERRVEKVMLEAVMMPWP